MNKLSFRAEAITEVEKSSYKELYLTIFVKAKDSEFSCFQVSIIPAGVDPVYMGTAMTKTTSFHFL